MLNNVESIPPSFIRSCLKLSERRGGGGGGGCNVDSRPMSECGLNTQTDKKTKARARTHTHTHTQTHTHTHTHTHTPTHTRAHIRRSYSWGPISNCGTSTVWNNTVTWSPRKSSEAVCIKWCTDLPESHDQSKFLWKMVFISYRSPSSQRVYI